MTTPPAPSSARREPVPRRFQGLPVVLAAGRALPVATGFRARLLGLAWLELRRSPPGLVLPRCSSVHTFGMRFPLDLLFLDRDGRVLVEVPRMPAGRVVRCRGAATVVELVPAGLGGGENAPAAP